MQRQKYFLKCLEDKKTDRSDPNLTSLSQAIRNFLETCLTFSLSETQFEQKKKSVNQVDVQKYDYINCWNHAVKTQLTAYSSRIQTTIKLYESSLKNDNPQSQQNLRKIEKVVKAAFEKLQLLNKLVANIIEEYARMHLWCACQRKECTSRFKSQVLSKNIQKFFLQTKPIKWAIKRLEKARLLQVTLYDFEYSAKVDFFQMQEDMQCDILSVQRGQFYQSMEEKGKKTQKLLLKMKIVDKQRQRCKVEGEWLRKMRKKVMRLLSSQK